MPVPKFKLHFLLFHGSIVARNLSS